MRRTTNGPEGHLDSEHLENLAARRARALPSGTVAHLEACPRCRGELEQLRRLHVAMAALAPLGPEAGFADRVLARVRLPLPLRARVLQTVRAHRLTTAAALGGAIGAIAGGVFLGAQYPGLTPMALTAFLVDRSLAVLWSGVLAVGRLAYEAGLVAGVEALLQQLTVGGALLLLATMSLVGMGTTRIMLRLLSDSASARRPLSAEHGGG